MAARRARIALGLSARIGGAKLKEAASTALSGPLLCRTWATALSQLLEDASRDEKRRVEGDARWHYLALCHRFQTPPLS